jgi:orotidine-5'-phosphate decarboxylase
MTADEARDRIALAADLPLTEAEALYARVSPWIGYVKVGLSLYVEHGPAAVRAFTSRGARVFLDLKLHDIPNTVRLASHRAGELGVSLLTVHAQGGAEMLRAAVEGARDGAAKAGVAPPKILAVTVLTSLRDEDVAQMGSSRSASDLAQHLAHFACEAGVDGLVCSPREAGPLRASLKRRLYLCTPGIRPAGAEAGDQARAETPAFAIRAGSDLLVAGRPIYGAPDPVAAARALHAEVSSV